MWKRFFTSFPGAYLKVSLIDLYRRIKNKVRQKDVGHCFCLIKNSAPRWKTARSPARENVFHHSAL